VPPLNLNSRTVTFTMWIYPGADGIGASTGLLMNRNGSDGAGFGFVLTCGRMPGNSHGRVGLYLEHQQRGYFWLALRFVSHCRVWNFVALVITNNSTTMYLYYCSSDENGATTNLFKAVNNASINASEAFGGGTTGLAVITLAISAPSTVPLTKWRCSPMP